jgi:hypothetical protein
MREGRCHRCNGTLVAEHLPDGERESTCIACGRPADALTPEQQAALKAHIDARETGGGGRKSRRPKQVQGVRL